MTRPDWDSYFIGIAEAVAARSDCERSKVGAVVVKDRRIRATGYNGSPSGQPGCRTCPRRTADGVEAGSSSYESGATRCVAIHAEANALLYCNREDLVGATLYVTRAPCYACEKLIQAAGVTEVWWPDKLREVTIWPIPVDKFQEMLDKPLDTGILFAIPTREEDDVPRNLGFVGSMCDCPCCRTLG